MVKGGYMNNDKSLHELKTAISTLPLDEACRIAISEIRSGIIKAHQALILVEKGGDEAQPMSKDQQQNLQMIARMGVEEAISSINELLVGVLLPRLTETEKRANSPGDT
jgi:hypothetical protein